MLTDTIIEHDAWAALDLETLAETAAVATLTRLGLDPAAHEIALLAADDARLAVLNADFRGKPQPTNVLSWPAVDLATETPGADPDPPEPGELGDIALAYETCAREAAEQGKPMAHHVTHLVCHGVLHLLGYDHITDEDAALMEGLERQILDRLGIPDPYEES